jgi:hypothetical protein
MSYLISTGSISDFSVRPTATSKEIIPELGLKMLLQKNIRNLGALNQVTRSLNHVPFEPVPLSVKAGLALKSITLHKAFEGFLQGCFNKVNEIYFLAWAWDMSGQPPVIYPGREFSPENWIYPMKKGDTIEMIGEGIPLFPKREIKGGVSIHIEAWESDEDIRQVGQTILEISEAVNNSELTGLLTDIAATNIIGANVALISNAVKALSNLIGGILKNNSNDYVGLFEGYYDVENWSKGMELYKMPNNHPAFEILLNKY